MLKFHYHVFEASMSKINISGEKQNNSHSSKVNAEYQCFILFYNIFMVYVSLFAYLMLIKS